MSHTANRLSKTILASIMLLGTLLIMGSLIGCGADNGSRADRSPRDESERPVQTYSLEELRNFNGQSFFHEDKTMAELKRSSKLSEGTLENGKYGQGIYIVSPDSVLKPGLYYMEGNQDTLSAYSIYREYEVPIGADPRDEITYTDKIGVQYIGNYFAELEDGDVLLFEPGDESLKMFTAPEEALEVPDPLLSGCYRVGVDIPAGTYLVSIEAGALETAEGAFGSKPGAYAMSSMLFPDWDTENVLITMEFEEEGPEFQEITVEEGQYLELFATQATLL